MQKKIVYIVIPLSKSPQATEHIMDVLDQRTKNNQLNIFRINRSNAAQNRKISLKGIPTMRGYDRDEFPMAMFAEGGAGAHVRYISPTDNRSLGSWISHYLRPYPDGTYVKFIIA